MTGAGAGAVAAVISLADERRRRGIPPPVARPRKRGERAEVIVLRPARRRRPRSAS